MDVPEDEGDRAAYVRIANDVPDASLDFCLVDGVYRSYCALASMPKLRVGGVLIIDNVNWFLPHTSRSPDSRSPKAGPRDAVWFRVHDLLQGWRCIWTSSGVTDTAFYFRPG